MAKYFLIIFIIATSFRFWQITSYPVSLTMDEVAIGYGSYSLLQTGRDDWGKILPIAFKSVGDYKPPVNFYLNIPSVFLFDLSEFAVRFPVALLGSLTSVIFIIFLRRLGLSKSAAIFGGFWLAILPWHVHYSRYGLEAVTALYFLIAGVACWLTANSRKSHLWMAFSIINFSLSVWAYHSNRLFVPLLVLFLLISQHSQLKYIFKNKNKFFSLLITLLISMGPFIWLTFTSEVIKQRAAMTSILREQSLQLTLHYGNYASLSQKIFDNDIYLIFHHWLGKYTNYFDLRFWFWKALDFSPPGYPDSGLFYLVDLPLFITGIFLLLKSKNKFLKSLTLFWLFVGPLASSFTMNDQHTLRTLVWLPFFGIIIAMGFKRYKLIYFAFLLLNIFYVKDLYTKALPRYFSEYWQYGFKQAAVYACDHKDEYDRIIISPTFGSLGPLLTGIPDYYVLFYCKYPPQKYMFTKKIDKFDFTRVDWRKEREVGDKTLLISAKWDYPLVTAPEESVIKRIDYFNESPAFYFVPTR
ncbi:MAG: glycosyl transferase family protein [Microgenomates group bacterium Gr01-1014_16]|nr:MAG: glycosyl transferase family protein [Microgenomates group bacterium Gr01-1014_16]